MEAPEKPIATATVDEPVKPSSPAQDQQTKDDGDGKQPPPLMAKLIAVLLISCISFGSSWSSGVTGAMKSTIKKVCNLPMVPIDTEHDLTYVNLENAYLEYPVFSPRSKRRFHGNPTHAG